MIEVPKNIPLPDFVGEPKPVVQMSETLASKINEIISAIAGMPYGPQLSPIPLATIIPNKPTVPPIPVPPPKQPFQAPEQVLKKGVDLGSKIPDVSSIQKDLTKSLPSLPSAESLKSIVPSSLQSSVESAISSIPKVDTTKVVEAETPKLETVKKFIT